MLLMARGEVSRTLYFDRLKYQAPSQLPYRQSQEQPARVNIALSNPQAMVSRWLRWVAGQSDVHTVPRLGSTSIVSPLWSFTSPPF